MILIGVLLAKKVAPTVEADWPNILYMGCIIVGGGLIYKAR